MLRNIWAIIFLLICSITDLKERKIYTFICVINLFAAFIMHLALKDIFSANVVWGIIPGMIFLAISLLLREAIGRGDALVVVTLGFIQGAMFIMELLVWALCMCCLFAIIVVFLKKKNITGSMPFVPFLFLGEIITLIVREFIM